jgi:dipeptidase E
MRALLLSNSTNFGEAYLAYPRVAIKDFLGQAKKNILFIPFAGVTINYDEYADLTANAFSEMGCSLQSIHRCVDAVEAVRTADAIVIGGGNSFHLLSKLYENSLIDVIRQKVIDENIPYIGWSAGSNMACPTLMTSNDMPISQPPSFSALNLVPFQINPHYTEAVLADHGGESRLQRLQEFLWVNSDKTVVCLPEGDLLRVEGDRLTLIGDKRIKVLRHQCEPLLLSCSDDINFLLNR